MSDLPNNNGGQSIIERLEKELNLKQLQITRLLNITQAINNNVSASDLFAMYESFLGWEMGVQKMALFFKGGILWKCRAAIGISSDLLKLDISEKLPDYTRLLNLEESDHPLLKEFDVVIPVAHKNTPLAYVFIGGFGVKEDMYNKVQLITAITNIVGVAIENKRLFNKQIEQERLRREMELATDMQRMLIPTQLPKGQGYELATIYRPHLNVGGDYFDFIEFLEEDTVSFCIGDISGKGLAAALLMANFQANFHSLISRRISLEEFIQLLNSAVLKITKGDRFITFFVAEFNRTTRKLTYINAGHNPPAMAMNGEITRLKKGCTILGIFDELPFIEVGEITIEDEALLLLFTDGLIDIKNKEGEFLDQEYGQSFVLENYKMNAQDFNDKMMKEIEDFSVDDEFPDDFTILTFKICAHISSISENDSKPAELIDSES